MAPKNSASSSRKGSSRTPVKYSEMRKSHKRKFCIGGSVDNYIDIIYWLRVMCSSEGSTFKGIPSLNSRGYPLVQIEVINSENRSAKFIICRDDLYLIAFTSPGAPFGNRKGSSKGRGAHRKGTSRVDSKGRFDSKVDSKVWFQFNTEYKIDDWETIHSHKGHYSSRTSVFDNIGRDCMSNAVNVLNQRESSLEVNASACEVFFLHLCEAARFRPIEFMVCRSLAPVPVGVSQFPFVWSGINNEEEENRLLSLGHEGENVSIEKDIYSLFEAAGDLHSIFTKQSRSDYIEELVKNYSNMSQIWYAYSLSGKKMFEKEGDRPMLSKLYMRCVKSVRFTVAVLCRLNGEKLLKALKGKVSDQEYENIESKIKGLQSSKEI